jgi:signal transduction histidine kinase
METMPMVVENIANHQQVPEAISQSRKTVKYTRVLRTELPLSDFRALCNHKELLDQVIEIVRSFPSLDAPTNDIFKILAEQSTRLTNASQTIIMFYDGIPKTWQIAGESRNSSHILDQSLINKFVQNMTLMNHKTLTPPVIIEQLIADALPYGVLLLPVVSEGMIIGIICLIKDLAGTDFNVTDFSVCLACEKICNSIIRSDIFAKELSRQKAQGEKLLAEISRAQSLERQRIGYELHDGIAQWLVGASIELDSCRIRLDQGKLKELYVSLDRAQETLRLCIQELRRSIANLRPMLITELGLLGAVRQMSKSFETESLKCIVMIKDQLPDFSAAEENAIYWIIQEALNNVRKHASASIAEVVFKRGSFCFEIIVIDDGKGYENKEEYTSILLPNKFGLEGMKERAKLFGWDILITGTRGVGTRVTLKLLNHSIGFLRKV